MQGLTMQRLKYLAAAAALSTLAVSPTLAGDLMLSQDPVYPRVERHHYRSTYINRSSYDSYRGAYRHRRSYVAYEDTPVYEHREPGFWPGDAAVGLVGSAIGTAGAIAGSAVETAGTLATAPFRAGTYENDSYVYDDDSGCQPGTYLRGPDGLWHLCR